MYVRTAKMKLFHAWTGYRSLSMNCLNYRLHRPDEVLAILLQNHRFPEQHAKPAVHFRRILGAFSRRLSRPAMFTALSPQWATGHRSAHQCSFGGAEKYALQACLGDLQQISCGTSTSPHTWRSPKAQKGCSSGGAARSGSVGAVQGLILRAWVGCRVFLVCDGNVRRGGIEIMG